DGANTKNSDGVTFLNLSVEPNGAVSGGESTRHNAEVRSRQAAAVQVGGVV
ncbi:hypothetical protein LINPERHAP1_LOCUS9640, partial [Linum perenne]